MNDTKLQKIADELEFDLEDVQMLMAVFIESAKESLLALRVGIDNSDYDMIFQSAHTIKGSAANLTLFEISNLAKSIESDARELGEIDLSIVNQLTTFIDQI